MNVQASTASQQSSQMHRIWCRISKGSRQFRQALPVAVVVVARPVLLLARRPLTNTQAHSRCALRFASGLPDWGRSSPLADPAASADHLENLPQASGHTDLIANAAGHVQDGPVGAAVSLVDHLHSVTGLPWWATLSVTALGIAPSVYCKPAVGGMFGTHVCGTRKGGYTLQVCVRCCSHSQCVRYKQQQE